MVKSKVVLSIALTAIIAVTTMTTAYAAPNDGSIGGKFINNVDGKDIVEYPVTPELEQLQKKKSAIADVHMKFKKGQLSKDKYIEKLNKLGADKEILNSAETAVPFSYNTTQSNQVIMTATASQERNRIMDLKQQPQITSYYCGPATVSEILNARVHILYSQNTLASDLRCSSSTAWYDGAGSTGYPVADTLNKYTGSTYYAPYGTTVAAGTFQSDVVFDIDNDYGVAGDAYEVINGPHLAGHPNKNIFHWFAIDGYYNYANDIWYVDSVAGATSISWYASVPSYSSMNYATLARIVNGRGIIW